MAAPPRRLALIGAKGMLASAVVRRAPAEYELVGLDLPEFDLTDRERVLRTIGELRPHVVLNCAAYTDVDGCESNERLATAVNGEGPGHLAEAAAEHGATLLHLSTDYVFDGAKRTPYREEDPPCPASAYGRSKWLGEKRVAESGLRNYFVLRTSWLYGPRGKNFVETIARLAAEREELRVVDDQVGCPTYTADLADAIFALLRADRASPPSGIYHFSNEGACSWHTFAREIVAHLRRRGGPVRVERLLPIPTQEYPLPAKRPPYSVLSKQKYVEATGAEVPHWQDGLARYMEGRLREG
ncbi:MAG: dTDP-4-dehydrorhamnose reductase [Deltaproteobacteria bacterium]|nr:dTDP-4-dehydrorhamnose reductase [Deltaproteobacteria bacterium]